jgi:low affinity Fe/Cu permease
MKMEQFRHFLTLLGVWTSTPAAFAVSTAFLAAWLALDRATFDWEAAATMATLFMTLVIQRAEHRDTQAIHGKLDEILRATASARTDVANLDEKEPEDIEVHRKQARREDQ